MLFCFLSHSIMQCVSPIRSVEPTLNITVYGHIWQSFAVFKFCNEIHTAIRNILTCACKVDQQLNINSLSAEFRVLVRLLSSLNQIIRCALMCCEWLPIIYGT